MPLFVTQYGYCDSGKFVSFQTPFEICTLYIDLLRGAVKLSFRWKLEGFDVVDIFLSQKATYISNVNLIVNVFLV